MHYHVYCRFYVVLIISDHVKMYTTSNAFKDEIPYHWNNLDIPIEIAVESLHHNVYVSFIVIFKYISSKFFEIAERFKYNYYF